MLYLTAPCDAPEQHPTVAKVISPFHYILFYLRCCMMDAPAVLFQ
jgi:hypothetical protein